MPSARVSDANGCLYSKLIKNNVDHKNWTLKKAKRHRKTKKKGRTGLLFVVILYEYPFLACTGAHEHARIT